MPGVIVINPAVFEDQRDALAVAWNEALRLAMTDMKFKPEFEVTPEQQEFFAETEYAEDEAALRRTIVARIATHDTSVSPTEEQEQATVDFLKRVAEMIGSAHRDADMLARMAYSVENGGARGEVSQGLPEDEAPLEESPEEAPEELPEELPPEEFPEGEPGEDPQALAALLGM